MEEAMKVLERSSEEAWENELGVGAVHRHVEKALAVLKRAAQEDTQAGMDASLSLGHLAHQSVESIIDLGTLPGHQSTHQASLQRVRNLLEK
jgi:hypothetical protein